MNNRRRNDGDETWYRLLNWTKGQKPSERLSALILVAENFTSIDPSHPLGGRDGLKDIVCIKNRIKYIVGAYFPRGGQTFNKIKQKFTDDIKGTTKNNATGFIFVTNQELPLKMREVLKKLAGKDKLEIYHLERIATVLNAPQNYGIRLEFLDIDMSKEEQLAYFAARDKKFEDSINDLKNDYHSFKKQMQTVYSHADMRSDDEILDAMEEFLDKVWYNRHWNLRYKIEKGFETVDPKIWEGALKAAKKVEEKYGLKNLGPWGDFEWGMINGKLSALRWVFGDEWDMLDT